MHASITARPFFEQRGYRVVRQQQVERGGVLLTNFVMEKVRPCPGAAQQAGAALRQWEKEDVYKRQAAGGVRPLYHNAV